MSALAVIPSWISKSENRVSRELLALVGGSFYLATLAQIAIPLPFTPVPITGQTFGVTTMALLWGRERATAVFGLYLLEGLVGLPVFARGMSVIFVGPTAGYLVGMWIACFVVGALADRRCTQTFLKSLAACTVGSAIIFVCGLIGLSIFMGTEGLLSAGLFPFLLGDLMKNVAAALLVTRVGRRRE